MLREERIAKLKDELLKTKPFLCYERALTLTEVYKENEDETVIVKKALAFKRLCETKTINIYDNELIVGNMGAARRAGLFSPDIVWDWTEDELDTMATREYDPYDVSEEAKKVIRDIVLPYWKGRSVTELMSDLMPAETHRLAWDSPIMFLGEKADGGPGQIVPDFDHAFEKGFAGIKSEAEEYLLKAKEAGKTKKIDFYRSVILCAEGMIILGRRYADLANKMAKDEKDENRKKELLAIAEACRNVPANPPRNFHETLQFLYFLQMGLFFEVNAFSYSPGRLDIITYPYYKKDIEENGLTKEYAQELIECLWIKYSEVVNYQASADSAKFWAGYIPYQNIQVGGTDAKGNDASNELSYMYMDACINVRLFQPTSGIIVAPNTPDALLEKAVELAKLGDGHPSFFSSTAVKDMLIKKGIPEDMANLGSLAGCSETKCPGMYQWSSGPWYNLGAIAEYALSDGYSKTRDDYYGARTGDPREFKTYEEFLEAIQKQVDYFMHHLAIANLCEEIAHEKNMPLPFESSFHSTCLEKGLDVTMGGSKYNLSPGLTGTGVSDLVNSIAAVKKLVYDDKKLTMNELITAIEADFIGYEDIQKMCEAVPKFGNDIEYVDDIAAAITDMVVGTMENHKGKFGTKLCSLLVPTSANVPFGMDTWALPSGRKARAPLADGMSPNQGTNLNGPTADIKSSAKMKPAEHRNGTIYNVRFTPKTVEGERGTKNIAALIRSYFEMGGFHMQFNMVSNEVLRAAQKKPEKYKGLQVRVAGYSAYFTELGREVQEDIISRTAHSF